MSKRFILTFVLTLLLFGLPLALTFAQLGQPIPCGTAVDASGKFTDPCTYQSVFTLINNILTYIVKISVPIGAIAIAYAGIQIILTPGDTGKHKQAIEIIKVVVGGLVAILASYLIIKAVLNFFVVDSLNKL